MNIDNNYIDTLLQPLQDNALPTLSEYIKEIEKLGVQVEGADERVDRKFATHLRYLAAKKLISNANGSSDLKSLGFHLSASGHIAITGHIMIMKTEKEEVTMPQNINIHSITSGNVQVGNNNSQITNINIQEIVEKVAASNDPEAKSILKSLLENSTVGSLLGAGASALIGLL